MQPFETHRDCHSSRINGELALSNFRRGQQLLCTPTFASTFGWSLGIYAFANDPHWTRPCLIKLGDALRGCLKRLFVPRYLRNFFAASRIGRPALIAPLRSGTLS